MLRAALNGNPPLPLAALICGDTSLVLAASNIGRYHGTSIKSIRGNELHGQSNRRLSHVPEGSYAGNQDVR